MDYIAVGLAGFLGAVTRAFLMKAVRPGLAGTFPVGTLLVNLTGCFILSFFLYLTMDRLKVSHNLRLAVGTGFLGAYTTFSTFALDTVKMLQGGQVWQAMAYIAATSCGCVLLAWAGAALSGTAKPERESPCEADD